MTKLIYNTDSGRLILTFSQFKTMKLAIELKTRRNLDNVAQISVMFVIAGRGPVYSGPRRWDHIVVQCACPGTKGIGRCVQCVLATCGKGGLSRSQQLVRYFYSAPLSRRGLLSDVALTCAVYYASQRPAKSIYFDSCRHGRQTWHC